MAALRSRTPGPPPVLWDEFGAGLLEAKLATEQTDLETGPALALALDI